MDADVWAAIILLVLAVSTVVGIYLAQMVRLREQHKERRDEEV